MNSRILLAAGLIMAAVLSGCGRTAAPPPDVPKVRTQTISLTGQLEAAEYAGYVTGRYETNLAFQVGGRIVDRYIEEGSAVRQGDVLMRLDSRDMQQSVNTSAAQVDAAAAKLKLAEADLNRYRQLFEQEAVSAAAYDQYRTAYDAALASLRQAEAQYGQSSNALSYTELTAHADGIVSRVNAEAGQVAAAGQTVAVLVSGSQREIEINVPENRLALLQNAPSISVSFWALPESLPVSAVVREIAPAADSVTRTYKVRLTLPDNLPEIQLGMTAAVKIAANSGQGIKIPLTAVYQTGDKPQVWLLKDGKACLQPIVIASWGDNAVYVAEGLADGDIVITAGVHKLADGQPVQAMDGDIK